MSAAMKKVLFILFLLPVYVFGQAPLRVEIEAKSSGDNYYIVPMGKQGVILFNETEEKAPKGQKMYSFTKYDTDFKEVWSKTYPVTRGVDFRKYDYDESNIYVLLSEERKNADFNVLQVDAKTGNIVSSSGKIPEFCSINDFQVVNGYAYLGGTTRPTSGQILLRTCFIYSLCCIPVFFGAGEIKTHPVLIYSDISGGKSMPITMKYKGSAGITDIGTNHKTKNAEVVVVNRPDKKTFKMEIKQFSADDVTGTINVDPKGTNELLTGRVMPLSNSSNKLMIGTYSVALQYKSFGEKLQRALSKTSSQSYSNGMYIAKFNGEDQEFIQYYAFSKFESFWNKIKNVQGTNAPKSKKKEKKTEARVNYQLLVHNIIERNNEFVMVAEAYYPEYHTETYYTYDANGRMVAHTRTVFDGYRYTHAIVAGFDKNGEKLWDNTFEIWDILTFNLKERVKVLIEGDQTVLAYSYGGSIKSKVISGNQIVDGKQSTTIQTNYDSDKVKADWGSDMEFWYDNFFITWGYQRIKNKEDSKKKDVKKRRTVFYFNKIAFS